MNSPSADVCCMATTRETGDEGERIAIDHLRSKGYVIIETQWRWGRNEVDIIARKDQLVCFVEVKYRKGNYGIPPWQAVNRAKQRAILFAADGYLRYKVGFEAEARFDIVSITEVDGRVEVEHIESAFYAM